MARNPPKMCIYCGIRPATENEHVIGKVFYRHPPKQGITVPSCPACNRGRGDGGARGLHLDEEYMRTILCLAEGSQDHPVVDALLTDKIGRGLRRRRFGGLRASILRTVGFTERKGEGGLYEPYSRPISRPDFSRFQRVLRKITKGLYYRIATKPLPDEYVVLANPVVTPRELPMMEENLRSNGSLEFQPADEYGVFKYMSAMKEDARTEWLMQFYNFAVCHTWTLPKNEVVPGDTGMPTTSDIL
jgi:hypothetical protein